MLYSWFMISTRIMVLTYKLRIRVFSRTAPKEFYIDSLFSCENKEMLNIRFTSNLIGRRVNEFLSGSGST